MNMVIYDKDGAIRSFRQQLESAASAQKLSSERYRGNPKDLGSKHAHIIVTHITDESWNALLNNFSGEGVLVRVSSAGFIDAPPPIVVEDQKCIFHLIRPANELTGEDCVRLLEVLSDINKAKVLIYEKQPQDVLRFFAHQTVSNLVALSILCQGYLAVHAIKSGDQWGPSEIRSALDHMGWESVAERAAETLGSEQDIKQKQGNVSLPEWWLDVFRKPQGELEELLANELGVKSIEDCQPLKKLSDSIYITKSMTPDIVAGAYCAISERLSGRPCVHR